MTKGQLEGKLAERGWRLVHYQEAAAGRVEKYRAAQDAVGAEQWASSPEELLRRIDSWQAQQPVSPLQSAAEPESEEDVEPVVAAAVRVDDDGADPWGWNRPAASEGAAA